MRGPVAAAGQQQTSGATLCCLDCFVYCLRCGGGVWPRMRQACGASESRPTRTVKSLECEAGGTKYREQTLTFHNDAALRISPGTSHTDSVTSHPFCQEELEDEQS